MPTPDAVVGQQAGFEEVYAAHHRQVLRLGRLLLDDPHEAEEVGQQVFLKLYQGVSDAGSARGVGTVAQPGDHQCVPRSTSLLAANGALASWLCACGLGDMLKGLLTT